MKATEFRTILLTTDLSEDSVKAYQVAHSLLEHYGASITLLSCIDTSIQYSNTGVGALEVPPIYTGGTDSQAIRDLQQQLSGQVREHFPGIDLTIEVRQGAVPVEHSIITYANEKKFDLIIMASHGRSGIRRALLGSVAEYVLRHARCPVLIVPTRDQS
jgi:nucleotide-binding universal stress UspA family protein